MKRQETLRSSSSRRSTPCRTNTDHQHQSHHVKSNVGCMAGILQLVQSKYQTRRKFLTFGKKQTKQQRGVSVSVSPAPIPSKKTEPPVPIQPPPTPAKPGAETTTPSTPAKTVSPEKHKDVMSMKLAAAQSDGSREPCRSPCETQLTVPRSPPLPADIRRSRTKTSTTDEPSSTPERTRSQNNRRSPPALVARLMGLDEAPTSTSHAASASCATPSTPDQPSASEKRRKLLGALEKCDEDLKTLRKVIEAARSEQRVRTPRKDKEVVVESPGGEKSGNDEEWRGLLASDENDHEVPAAVKVVDGECRKKGSGGGIRWSGDGNYNQEERSPVSVLDHDATQSSPPSSCSSGGYSRKIRKGKGEVRSQPEQVQLQQRKNDLRKKGEVKRVVSQRCFVSKPIDILPLLLRPEPEKIDRVPVFPPGSSRAMIETVDEVCKDISWGQRREVGIIGLLVQDGIFRDLVDEVLGDLGGGGRRRRRLHSLESCKRKICF